MSLYELLSFTDDEIEVITSAVCRWSKTNHVNLHSERGRAALNKALLLVSSGVTSPDDIVAGLGGLSAPRVDYPSSATGEPRASTD